MRGRVRAFLNRYVQPRLQLAAQRALEREARDIEQARQREALASTVRFLDQHAPEAAAFPDAEALMAHAASLVPRHTPGLICEFGVWKGESLRRLAGLFPDRVVYGFDSFEGLPADWRPGFPRGHFRLETPPSVPSNAKLVVGRFEGTLSGFLREHTEPVLFVHVDCDIYPGARTILKELEDRVAPGTVLLFDEYFNYPGWERGEHRAFGQFLEARSTHCRYVGFASAGEQLAVQLL